jgi:hypothetical protein
MKSRNSMTASLALALLLLLGLAPGARADFGIKSFSATAVSRDGSADNRAASHPYEFKVQFGLNLREDALETPEGRLRTLIVELPRGMVGNPIAVPSCPMAAFEAAFSCPPSTQVGIVELRLLIGGTSEAVLKSPIYNLPPALGSPAVIGFNADGIDTFQTASVRTGGDYGVSISDFALPAELEFQSVTERIWGVPADAAHSSERACGGGMETYGCSSEAQPAPYLTLPSSCGDPLRTVLQVESLEDPGVFVSRAALSEGPDGNPSGMVDCVTPPFTPTVSTRPEVEAADSPSGLDVDLHVPQIQAPEGVGSANLRDTAVVLPAGIELNPSGASGLGGCSLAQVGLDRPEPAQCPGDSKVGSVEVLTPLVAHPLAGSVYLARQGENPFHSLLALYVAVFDPITGVVVKLPGKVVPDEATGQLTATFEGTPQLPFEDFRLHFFGGPRASLSTPPTCGTYTTNAMLTPWTTPEGADVRASDSFDVTKAAQGGACPLGESQMPNGLSFEAGTVTPIAGTYSPFVLRLSRENGSQRLRTLNLILPPGLSGRLAGLNECSDAQIVAAESRNGLGQGELEQARSSCPASSELGLVDVGAGSGAPLHVQGHAYLAGPYKGAPLSLAIVTPAVAGPFDLGTVVVRSALYVNEETARITVRSDPIPAILHGIPLELRSLAVKVNHPRFTLNPTSCKAMAVLGEAVSPIPTGAPLAQHFQVGGCAGLGFAPRLALSVKGSTKRAGHPALKAVVTYPRRGAYANIARAQVGLPSAELLDQGNLNKVCTQAELHSSACPKSSIYGRAKAWTPLLGEPLEGPVYLGVGYGHKLPDLVADLKGQIRILLHGKVDTTKQGGLRNTFEVVPDAPVSRFVLEMKGGMKYGLLENSEDVCVNPQHASAHFVAQNGKAIRLQPKIRANCGRDETRGANQP